jgi:hypothetical protein
MEGRKQRKREIKRERSQEQEGNADEPTEHFIFKMSIMKKEWRKAEREG